MKKSALCSRIDLRTVLAVLPLFILGWFVQGCSTVDDVDPDSSSFGKTPQEYIEWLESNDVDFYLDQYGNPYSKGEIMLYFENGYDEDKLNDVIDEIALLNDIPVDSVTVKNCGCGTEDYVLIQYEEKLNANLEPAIGTMGDPDGDNDGLSSETSQGVSVTNNYYLTPLPENLNNAGIPPRNFGPPNQAQGEGFLQEAGQRIVIAILDSGFDFDHPDLPGYANFALWRPPFEDCYHLGYDFVNQVGIANDEQGHGTQVAGVILETLKDFDVPLAFMPLRISDNSGAVSSWDMFCAMSYAVSHGANIVNISAGWYGGPNPIIQRIIDDHPDVLFVCSAGNEGTSTDMFQNGHFPSGYTYLPNVVSVGALNEAQTALATFSNYGAISISIAAPGENVETLTPCDGPICDDPTDIVSGTSFSTPYVTAVAAAVLHCTPIQADEVRPKLYDFGLPLPTLFGKLQSGKELDILQIPPIDSCRL